MAARQKPVTEPVLDNSMDKEYPSEKDSKIVHALPTDQFNSIIRNLKKMDLEVVKQVVHCTYFALRDLKVGRDLDEAIPGMPKGSDHFDFGTFKTWVSKIKPEDTDSVEQLVAIDATAKVRVIS